VEIEKQKKFEASVFIYQGDWDQQEKDYERVISVLINFNSFKNGYDIKKDSSV